MGLKQGLPLYSPYGCRLGYHPPEALLIEQKAIPPQLNEAVVLSNEFSSKHSHFVYVSTIVSLVILRTRHHHSVGGAVSCYGHWMVVWVIVFSRGGTCGMRGLNNRVLLKVTWKYIFFLQTLEYMLMHKIKFVE